MSKLIVVIGLPGSGKTHYLESLKNQKKISGYYDDYQKKAYGKDHDPRLSRHYGPLMSKLKTNKTFAISDILYCRKKDLDALLLSVLAVLPETQIELHYFENEAKKVVTNIKARAREHYMEKELNFVKENSPKYVIPKIKKLTIHSKHETAKRF